MDERNMFRVWCILIGYAIGCVQTAYLIGRFVKKIDIREHGSGNAGTTNTFRVMGKRLGALVFLCDVLKGAVGYVLCSLLFDGSGICFTGALGLLPGLYAGLGVVLGHDFPFYMGFKGGKGIASTLGVIACIQWQVAAIDFLTGIGMVVTTRIVSITSLWMLGLFPILLLVYGHSKEAVGIGFVLAIIAYVQHRGNIVRLVQGNERKIVLKKKERQN